MTIHMPVQMLIQMTAEMLLLVVRAQGQPSFQQLALNTAQTDAVQQTLSSFKK